MFRLIIKLLGRGIKDASLNKDELEINGIYAALVGDVLLLGNYCTDQKIRVHIFCSLLGLTLATILHKEVSKRGFESSKFHLLDVLSSIRSCWIKDKNSNKATNVLEAMDNRQTTLWNIIQTL